MEQTYVMSLESAAEWIYMSVMSKIIGGKQDYIILTNHAFISLKNHNSLKIENNHTVIMRQMDASKVGST